MEGENMSDSKHTPGPWEVAYTDANGQAVVKGEHIEICTCWHHSVESIRLEMEGNARLIASAPALLAELSAAIGYMRNARIDLETGCPKATAIRTLDGGLARAEAALAKATA